MSKTSRRTILALAAAGRAVAAGPRSIQTRPGEGRFALITGSSRGIAAPTAKRLASEGYAITVNYLASRDLAEQIAAATGPPQRRSPWATRAYPYSDASMPGCSAPHPGARRAKRWRPAPARQEHRPISSRRPTPRPSCLGGAKSHPLRSATNQQVRWSERRDSNPRPLDPQSSALPGCATLRRLRRGRVL